MACPFSANAIASTLVLLSLILGLYYKFDTCILSLKSVNNLNSNTDKYPKIIV